MKNEWVIGRDVIECDQYVVKEEESLTVLGTKVISSGRSEEDVEERRTRAWRCFHQKREYLMNRKVPLWARLMEMTQGPMQVLLWGSESWQLNKTLARSLQVTWHDWLQRILGFTGAADENQTGYVCRDGGR